MDRQEADGDAQAVPGWLVPGEPVPRSPAGGPGVTGVSAPQRPGNRSVWRPKQFRWGPPTWRRQAHQR